MSNQTLNPKPFLSATVPLIAENNKAHQKIKQDGCREEKKSRA
jgi:hypothetical protein